MKEIQIITNKLIRIADLIDSVDLKKYNLFCYPSVSMKKESERKVKRLLRFKEFYLTELQRATNWEQGETSNLKRDINLNIA